MLENAEQRLGVLLVSIHIPSAQSLKDKRMVMRSVRERVKSRFNVSVAELDGQDKWQTATFGFAMIGTDNRLIDSSLQKVLNYIESFGTFYVCDHRVEVW